MRTVTAVIFASAAILTTSIVGGQPSGRPEEGSKDKRSEAAVASFITRMMTFDSNHDGKLSKTEVTDARLFDLFADADVDKDDIVTKEELTTYYDKESVHLRRGGFTGGGLGGPGGPGGPNRRGPGGRGGPGMGGPPPIGEVLPPHARDMLRLSSAQRRKVDALQKQVDTKLEQILTDEQKAQWEEIRSRGPGRPGGPDEEREGFGPQRDGNRGGEPAEPKRPQRPSEKPPE